MVLLIFVFGVLNLCLGYAIAVYLGFESPDLPAAWKATLARYGFGNRPDAPGAKSTRTVVQEVQPVTDQPPAASPILETPNAEAVEPPSDRFDLETLRRIVDRFTGRLGDLAGDLKAVAKGRGSKTPWSLVTELQEVCEPYLRDLCDAADRLDAAAAAEDSPDGEAQDSLSDQAEQLLLEQVAQLETSLSNLQCMDFNTNLSGTMNRLTAETDNTLAGAQRLQRTLRESDQPDPQEAVPTARPVNS